MWQQSQLIQDQNIFIDMTLNRLFEVVQLKERPAGFIPEETPQQQKMEVNSEFTFSEVSDDEQFRQEQQLLDSLPKEYFVKFKIDPEKVMMKLSKGRLKRLQKVWQESDNGLALSEFVQLMLREVPIKDDERLELIHGLIKLFHQVDINGDQIMQWSEFIQYIIDAVSSESIKQVEGSYGKVKSIKKILEEEAAAKFRKMKRSGIPIDVGKHKSPMQDVLLCEGGNSDKGITRCVLHSEDNSKSLQWYDLNMKPITTLDVPINGAQGKILSIAYKDMQSETLSFGPQGTISLFVAAGTDFKLHLIVYGRGYYQYLRAVPTGKVLQPKVWYLKKHKAWVTAGSDYMLRQWNLAPNTSDPQIGDPIQLHSDNITDIIEIAAPQCIATASLDRTIVMYDLKNKEVLRRLENGHKTGVKKLCYIQNFGGQLLSLGFEIFVNVWGPENLFGDALLGCLKGHRKPITDMGVSQERPFVFTMDEQNEVIIWDIRNYFVLQSIPPPGQKEKLTHGLIVISPTNFWAYGNRFINYDLQDIDDEEVKDESQIREENLPLQAFYNKFFDYICVQTMRDLKLYSCADGDLLVFHQNVFSDPQLSCVKIRQDSRHRKAYLASNDGQVTVTNIQSGVALKQVFEDEETHKRIEQFKEKAAGKLKKKIKADKTAGKSSKNFQDPGVDEEEGDKKEQGREIVDMALVWNEDVQQMIYCDKQSFYVYNEEDEKSEQLRKISGTSKKSNITSLQYNEHLSLIATGTDVGEVVVWDYELSNILGICLVSSQPVEITQISFLDPYPVMVTASADCRICLWGVRPIPSKYAYICLYSFINSSFNYHKEQPYVCRSFCVWKAEKSKGISRGRAQKHQQINADVYRDFMASQVLSHHEASIRTEMIKGKQVYRGQTQMQDSRLQLLKQYNVPDPDDEEGRTKLVTRFESMRVPRSEKSELLDPNYDADVDVEKDRIYVYIGDDFGIMKLWDVTYLLESSIYEPTKSWKEIRSKNYNPVRKENINAAAHFPRHLQLAQQAAKKMPEGIDPEDKGLIIREVVAHKTVVHAINRHEQGGVITCSKDGFVRLWSNGLDLWGSLNQFNFVKDNLWSFPIKDKQQKEDKDIGAMNTMVQMMGTEQDKQRIIKVDQSERKGYQQEYRPDFVFGQLQKTVDGKKQSRLEEKVAAEQARQAEKDEWRRQLITSKPAAAPTFEKVPYDPSKMQTERVNNLVAQFEKYENMVSENVPPVQPSKGLGKNLSNELSHYMMKADMKKIKDKALADQKLGQLSSRQTRPKLKNKKSVKSSQQSLGENRSNASRHSRASRGASSNSSQQSKSKNGSQVGFKIKPVPSAMQKNLSMEQKPLNSDLETPNLARKQTVPPSFSSANVGSITLNNERNTGPLAIDINKNQRKSPSPLKNASNERLKEEPVSVSPVKNFGSQESLSGTKSPSKLMMKQIESIPEEDGSPSARKQKEKVQVNNQDKRQLDELNQTATLMRKLQESEKTHQHEAFNEEAQQIRNDRQSLLQYKNLPSIREKLESVKTKMQRAQMNPKFNKTPAPVVASADIKLEQQRRSKRFSPFEKIKKRSQAMDQLQKIAAELEYFDRQRDSLAGRSQSLVQMHRNSDARSEQIEPDQMSFMQPSVHGASQISQRLGDKRNINIYNEYEAVKTPQYGSAGPKLDRNSLPMRKNASALHNPMINSGIKSPLNYQISASTPSKHAIYLNNSKTPNESNQRLIQPLNGPGLMPLGLQQMRNNSVENLPALIQSPYVGGLGVKNADSKRVRDSVSLTHIVDETAASMNKDMPSASFAKGSNSVNLSGHHEDETEHDSRFYSYMQPKPRQVYEQAAVKLGNVLSMRSPSQISLSHQLQADPSRQYLDITFQGNEAYEGFEECQGPSGRNNRDKLTYRTVADAERQAQINSKFNLSTKKAVENVLTAGDIELESKVSYGGSVQPLRRDSRSTLVKGAVGLGSFETTTAQRKKKINLRQASIENKLETYSALKRKYTGPDCLIGQIAKKEALKIQEQRKRISELKEEFALKNKRAYGTESEKMANMKATKL